VPNNKKDSDAPIDRLLSRTLEARATAPPGDTCLDAGTVAAWADGALDARERARVEAHAADCGRCQAMLAAMITSMPAPDTARSWRRVPAMGWLVPLTLAATALVVWIAAPNRSIVQRSDSSTVDQVSPTAPAAPDPAAAAEAKDQTASRSQRQLARDQVSPTAPAAPDRAAASEAKGQTASRSQGQLARDSDTPAAVAPGDLRERRPAEAAGRQASPALAAGANALADSANAAPAAPLAGVSPTSLPAAGGAPPVSAPAAAPSASIDARREGSSSSAQLAFANRLDVVIVSSNPATRFRLLPGGGVQRSADGGSTWRSEATGTTAPLTAGASPSPSVCWLVGPSGTVLLSIDGRSWRRLAFPEAVDLRSVTASDSENATVTAADGRAFVTTDGGQNWSRAPGL
jgi:hypothetical protein